MKKIFTILITIILAGGAGFGLGYFSNQISSEQFSEFRNNPENQYKFINPLLECNDIENVSNKKVMDMKEQVQDFINNETSKKNISFVSVYFRDLNNGPWFGINEKENFYPGSLLKVPLMMSVLKVAESNPAILDEKILYEGGEEGSIQYFKPERQIEQGKIYTTKELIEAMIEYSDNNATALLTKIITSKQLDESYSDLGVEVPQDGKYTISVRNYASFFRILFNATYLNRDLSEISLNLLSQSTFKDGLRQGVPMEISISHKFGERIDEATGTKQLHDCGIIYYPDKPYLLCIMTRGDDFDKLSSVIQSLSKIIYEKIIQ